MKDETENLPLKQKGFSVEWQNDAFQPPIATEGFFPMREWQQEAFEQFKNAPFMILNAPMGSGKSWLMCFLAAYKMKNNPILRSIIAVPQTIIAPGFTEAKLQMPDGEKFHWSVKHDLCLKKPTKSTSEYIINWLKKPHSFFSERTLLCSHAALVAVHKKLKSEGHLNLFANLLLWIDEAHHVKGAGMRDIDDTFLNNALGRMVSSLLQRAKDNIQIGLTTATHFRGDRYRIFLEDTEEMFEFYKLPYDRYFESMIHLQSFSFDFLLCGHDYTKTIGSLASQRRGKDIIYIPHPMSRCSLGDKLVEVQKIINEYQNIHRGNSANFEDTLITLKIPKGEFKILNLVDVHRRTEKKELFRNEDIKKNRNTLDAIIALGMFKEGGDWIFADRCIIVGARASLVEVIQMVGRLLRDAPGKKHVEIIQLLPFSLDQYKDDIQNNLNNYFKAICASLLLEDVLMPVEPLIPKKKGEIKDQKESKLVSNRLSDLVSNEAIGKSLIEEGTKLLMNVCIKAKKENQDIFFIYDQFRKEFSHFLEDSDYHEDSKEICDKIYSMWTHRTLNLQGINVKDINIDMIVATNPLEGLLRYTSQACGIDTFKELRKAIDSSKALLSEELICSWIKKYIDKHNKKKPTQKSGVVEFVENDYQGITWLDINNCLKKGLRGLPGGITLPAFIEKKFGMKGRKVSTFRLSEELICSWIKKHIDTHDKDKKPTKRSGIIEFAEGDYYGLTWGSVDSALHRGSKGLQGGTSLADLIEKNFGIINPKSIPVLSEEKILYHAKKFKDKHGRKPHCNDGDVDGVENLTWRNIDGHLRQRESSLSKFLEKKLGIKAKNTPQEPPLPLIQEWIKKYFEKHKKIPSALSQNKVEFAEGIHKGITWGTVHSEVKKGRCGLPKGTSLAEVVKMTLEIKSNSQ